MEFPEPRLESGQAIGRGLDDDLLLPILFDLPLPAIDGGHRRQQVHAGRQLLLNQRTGQRGAVGVGGDGRQHEDGLRYG